VAIEKKDGVFRFHARKPVVSGDKEKSGTGG